MFDLCLAIGVVIDFGGAIGLGEASPLSTEDIGSGGGSGRSGDTVFSVSLPSMPSVISFVAQSVGGRVDNRGMIRVPLWRVPRALRVLSSAPLLIPMMVNAAEGPKAEEKSFVHSLAFYVGPLLDMKYIFVTVGACLGGFGCLAGGGGVVFGRFGLGVLFPFWKWW